jgi:hypothetical protein
MSGITRNKRLWKDYELGAIFRGFISQIRDLRQRAFEIECLTARLNTCYFDQTHYEVVMNRSTDDSPGPDSRSRRSSDLSDRFYYFEGCSILFGINQLLDHEQQLQ